jgi:hypothetical protein
VAQNLERPGGSAIDARTTQHAGYAISQRKRKRVEECFGWLREFSYLGVGSPGPRADMFEIGRPDLDWTLLAKGMGVPGTRVSSLDAFGKALRAGLESEGPTLIEVSL